MTAPHPAPFSAPVLDAIRSLTAGFPKESRVLDPFAGIGRVHELGFASVGVEIEPEWANQHRRTIVGDSRRLHFPDGFFDGVITSPAYGNRMADHHNARDASRRITYRHKLGRALTDGNSGKMQWGEKYQELHRQVWSECWRVIRSDGFFVLNISDHIRKGVVVPVSDWHHHALFDLGFRRVKQAHVETQRMRFGQNHDVRVDGEHVWLYSRG